MDSQSESIFYFIFVMDSFGTACNVTGDGAIALIVDKLTKKNC